MSKMKKIIATAVALTVLVWAGGPALALTAEELLASIQTLQTQLNELMTQYQQLTGTTTTGYAGIPAGFTFTKNLKLGMTDSDVVNLKIILAAENCVSGLANTTYFGSKTLEGTKCFCNKYKDAISTAAGYTVTCSGFVGTGMRVKLNALLAVAPTPTPTPTACTTDADCLTGQTCQAGVCVAPTPTPTPAPSEGTFTVVRAASPVGGTVNGGLGIEAFGIDVTARGSDITIGKVDLQTAVVVNAVAMAPSTFITGIKVYDTSVADANLKTTFTSPVYTYDTVNNVWYTSLTGLNFVVSKDAKKKLLLVVDTATAFDVNRVVTFQVYGNGIRGRDTAGIDTFMPLAAPLQMVFQRPGLGVLTLSTSSANPNSQNTYSDPNVGVQTPVPILVFNAKATAGDAILGRLELVNAASNVASEAYPSILYLYAGDTLVSSAVPNVPDAATIFTDFSQPIAQNQSVVFTVKSAWNARDNSSVNNFRVTLPAGAAGGLVNDNRSCIYFRGDGSQVGCMIPADINGNTQFVFEQGVKITYVSASSTVRAVTAQQSGTATGVFKFKVQPFGGTLAQLLYASQTTGVMDMVWVEAYWTSGSAVGASGVVDSVLSRALAQSPGRDLNDGEEGTVTVTMGVESNTSYGTGTLRFKLEGITWDVGNIQQYQGNGSGGNFTDTWFTDWGTIN